MTQSIAGWISHRWTKYAVIAFWLVLVALLGPLAGQLTDVQENEAENWLPSSAESTKVLDAASAFSSPNVIPAVVVYERDGGLAPGDMEKAAADAEEFGALEGAGEVVGPIPSEDGEAIETIVPLDLGPDGWNEAPDAVDDMTATADSTDGLDAYVTGPLGQAADSAAAFEGIDSTLLLAAAGVVTVLLLLTYRSPFLWLLPVISAGVALTGAQAVIVLLAKHANLTVDGQSAGILTVLVFGAGTDYALLLVARYREELRRHEDRHDAMALALHRAGPAIIASGATVAIGMLCLLLAQMTSTRGLGPVAAIGIVVGLMVMLTLLPALLVVLGRWVFWPRIPHFGDEDPAVHGFWSRIGTRISHRPRRVWVVTSLILLALTAGITQLNANGLTVEESFRGTPASVEGEQVLSDHFPGGAGNPVVVVTPDGTQDDVAAAVAQADGIDPASVTDPQVADGWAYFEATLDVEPDSDAAYDVVDDLRADLDDVGDGEALVGGGTAINLDIQRASAADNRVIIPAVLLVVLLILMVLLRAVTAPLILLGTVVLSFAAALGVSALIFTYVFDFAGADSAFPLFVFVFLVALGIDYNIFLMTRVREESLRFGTRRGALIGLTATGGVITSAGLVLAGTFLALGTLPLVAFAEIGFAVALGVLLDTLVVRSVLVTALNLDVGRHMWWPSALGRVEDVEDPGETTGGEALADTRA
ncbi:RND superfamily putative drug exporter [Mumia flava]|uniref:RND superfamily putative drug exporter n=1 Tax=Mumia flava TaxID=1348852 RepID=A0A0B2BLB4_9ACTN|nr:MMPL family transporter [Mumia flava]PJJ54016.1 RND superfamily putative drug exporter [Mumia flava]